MTNPSNTNRRNSPHLTNTLLQDLQSYDFVTTFPPRYQLPTNISNENAIISNENGNVDQLKNKINRFLQEHPNVIVDIKNYFYDETMTYVLKQALEVPLTGTDMTKTERLLNRFFIEHEANIRIIFTYFFDDIKLFLPENYFLSLTSGYRGINAILNRGACQAFIFLLKAKGAPFLTSILYRTHIVVNQNEELPEQLSVQTQTTSNPIKFASIIAYVIILCFLFGWEIFLIMLYFCIGLTIIVFFVYLFLRPQTI